VEAKNMENIEDGQVIEFGDEIDEEIMLLFIVYTIRQKI